jgi:sugar lactone lactonase YvrE
MLSGNKLELTMAVYFNDSVAMKVYAYDFDLDSGSISNKRLLVDRRDTFGEPDGMVVE